MGNCVTAGQPRRRAEQWRHGIRNDLSHFISQSVHCACKKSAYFGGLEEIKIWRMLYRTRRKNREEIIQRGEPRWVIFKPSHFSSSSSVSLSLFNADTVKRDIPSYFSFPVREKVGKWVKKTSFLLPLLLLLPFLSYRPVLILPLWKKYRRSSKLSMHTSLSHFYSGARRGGRGKMEFCSSKEEERKGRGGGGEYTHFSAQGFFFFFSFSFPFPPSYSMMWEKRGRIFFLFFALPFSLWLKIHPFSLLFYADLEIIPEMLKSIRSLSQTSLILYSKACGGRGKKLRECSPSSSFSLAPNNPSSFFSFLSSPECYLRRESINHSPFLPSNLPCCSASSEEKREEEENFFCLL